jgi:hypothetical protein
VVYIEQRTNRTSTDLGSGAIRKSPRAMRRRCKGFVAGSGNRTPVGKDRCRAELRRTLKEYGAWDATELADHDQNLQRILWLAAGDISDSNIGRRAS